MNKWLGYLLLTAGALLLLRSRADSLGSLLGGGSGAASGSEPTGGGGGGGGLTVGQIGSNFIESNSLADAVQGLVNGLWDNGGQGYGGFLTVKTADGNLEYRPPQMNKPIRLGPAGKYWYDP